MGFMRRLAAGAGMGLTRNLANPRTDLLSRVSYQYGSSERGLPLAQLNLTFTRPRGIGGGMLAPVPTVWQAAQSAANPEMTLAVLVDRSGSMTETFNDGHVQNALSTIFGYVATANTGFHLLFYDSEPTDAGYIEGWSQLQSAINTHRPRGYGTYVRDALRLTIERRRSQRGIYVIVITDGEFQDKTAVQAYVMQLLPQLTPENPYAFRLHFVGAGEEVDREFLQQLETAASGQGAIQMVKHHHHAHLRHSHDSMLDELDRAFLGPGAGVVIGEATAAAGGQGTVVTRVGDLAIHRWWEGAAPTVGFIPRRAQIGIEFTAEHPSEVPLLVRFRDGTDTVQDIRLDLPLPRVTAQATAPPAQRRGFHLPWRHTSPEDDVARQAAAQERAALAQRVEQVRRQELERQTTDARLLGQGGIPSMAQQRLAELRGADPAHAVFTSDLSPDEAALLRRNGYRPLGLVCGSAMYHVGLAYASSYSDCEVTVLSQAYNTATRLAVDRMEQEATALGAHGVVGVRFDIVRHEWGEKSIEVQLIGTAIAGPPGGAGGDGSPIPGVAWRPARGQTPTARTQSLPWLSDLSGQEWWALHRAGYDPAGLVYGHCTWFILTTQFDEWSEQGYQNQELVHFSDALRQCRDRANSQIRASARELGAVGVVGVHLTRKLDEIRLTGPGENPAYEREHHNLTLSMIGTAVRVRPDAPTAIRATTNVLSLRDGRIKPAVVSTAAATFE